MTGDRHSTRRSKLLMLADDMVKWIPIVKRSGAKVD